MRLAWFSPLRYPARSRSAFYSEVLLPALAAEAQIDCFVPDSDFAGSGTIELEPGTSGKTLAAMCGIYHFHRAAELHREHPYDFFVYHFEDAAEFHYVRLFSRIWPGIKIFHDLRLNRLYRSEFRHSTGGTDLNKMVDDLFGPASPRIGDYHVRKWPHEVFDADYPMGRPEWSSDGLNAVFGRRVKQLLELPAEVKSADLSGAGNKPQTELLKFPLEILGPEQAESLRREQRRRMGIDSDAFVIACGGEYLLEDRAGPICRAVAAFSQSKAPGTVQLLWLAAAPENVQLAQTAVQRYLSDAAPEVVVRIEQPAGGEDAQELICAADVMLAPRATAQLGLPLAGLRALCGRVPLAIDDLTAGCDLPREAAFRVSAGPAEEAELRALLQWIFENRSARTELAGRAHAAVSKEHNPETAARRFFAMLAAHRQHLCDIRIKTEQRYFDAQRSLLAELFSPVGGNRAAAAEPVLAQAGEMFRRAAIDFGWLPNESRR